MDVIVTSKDVDSSTITAMVSYLESRSAVCAKVLDVNGDVVAINRRGLELLCVDATDICGKMWTSFWSGDARVSAENAVARAFGGNPARFVGEFHGVEGLTFWEVETFPLERAADGTVHSILVISVNITKTIGADGGQDNLDLVRALSQTLHAVSNLTNVTASSARLLTRSGDDARVRDIAQGLEQAAADAKAAVDALRQLTQRVL